MAMDGYGGQFREGRRGFAVGNVQCWEECLKQQQEEEEELITDILRRRLAALHKPFHPPEPIVGPADVLILVRKSPSSSSKCAAIRAHSLVLKRCYESFQELIELGSSGFDYRYNDTKGFKFEGGAGCLENVANIGGIDADPQREAQADFDDAFDLCQDGFNDPEDGSHDGNVVQLQEQTLCDQIDPRCKMKAESVVEKMEIGRREVDSERKREVQELSEASQNLVNACGWADAPIGVKNFHKRLTEQLEKYNQVSLKGEGESSAVAAGDDQNSKQVFQEEGPEGIGNPQVESMLAQTEAGSLFVEEARVEVDKSFSGRSERRSLGISEVRRKSYLEVDDEKEKAESNEGIFSRRKSAQFMESVEAEKARRASGRAQERANFANARRKSSRQVMDIDAALVGNVGSISTAGRMSDAANTMQSSRTGIQDGTCSQTLKFEERPSVGEWPSSRRPSGILKDARKNSSRRASTSNGERSRKRSQVVDAEHRGPLKEGPIRGMSLAHTRNEETEQVVRFYEEEAIVLYETPPTSAGTPDYGEMDYVIILPASWKEPTLHAILEFFYTEACHISCAEIDDVYVAANSILLSSLTDSIKVKPQISFMRLALLNEENRKALLNLSRRLTNSLDLDNWLNDNKDFENLFTFCSNFEFCGPPVRKPYILFLKTARRDVDLINEGLHILGGQTVGILRIPRTGTRLHESHEEEDQYLTFEKAVRPGLAYPPLWAGAQNSKMSIANQQKNRMKGWRIIFFGYENIPEKCYNFYKYLASISHRPWQPEVFRLRIIMGLRICPLIQKAIRVAFPELVVNGSRGSGDFIGGETHGNSLVLEGLPRHILGAAVAIPKRYVGRTALRVGCPTARTFTRLFSATWTFGMDFETNALYFIKPLTQIVHILEFLLDFCSTPYPHITTGHEVVELVIPTDPF